MQLSETAALDDNDLPVAAFRAHLRLGAGFADETSQDGALAGYLRAAIGVIEARTGKALIIRGFRLILPRWRWVDSQALPVAPVAEVTALAMRDGAGDMHAVDAGRWRLWPDDHRPRILATGAFLPAIPRGGQVEIEFDAGLAADWAGVPGDLVQAVFLLAAQYYEARSGAAGGEVPAGVAALIARWQQMRLTAGGTGHEL